MSTPVSGDGGVLAPAVGAISVRGPREARCHLGGLVTSRGAPRSATAEFNTTISSRGRRGVGFPSRHHHRHLSQAYLVRNTAGNGKLNRTI
ncbi:unnamed protein product [Leptosia nina]|uniref:Uncharacterized protein n=1 Tax=Leptosia nina TaxID=320188 RepID=A0AAV1J3T5_9NEOP